MESVYSFAVPSPYQSTFVALPVSTANATASPGIVNVYVFLLVFATGIPSVFSPAVTVIPVTAYPLSAVTVKATVSPFAALK